MKKNKGIRETALEFQKEVRKNTATAILAAFGFIIALVWRDAIKGVVDEVVTKLKIGGTGYIYLVITAVIITVICVAGIMFFSRWSEKK